MFCLSVFLYKRREELLWYVVKILLHENVVLKLELNKTSLSVCLCFNFVCLSLVAVYLSVCMPDPFLYLCLSKCATDFSEFGDRVVPQIE